MSISVITDPGVMDAWVKYLAETTDARDEYDQAVNLAHASRNAAFAEIDQATHIARELAWQAACEITTQAWAKYIDDTRDARARRDVAIEHAAAPLDPL